MDYKRLGRCGLKVGAISPGAGSWGTGTADEKCVREMMAQAMDMGIIYFDNAESYANGNAEGVAPGTRAAAMAGLPDFGKSLTDRRRNAIVAQLGPVAPDLGVPLPQLTLAWCARNPDVSTLIIGSSRPQQIVDNVKALDLVPLLPPEVFQRIDNVIGDYGESWLGDPPWHYGD